MPPSSSLVESSGGWRGLEGAVGVLDEIGAAGGCRGWRCFVVLGFGEGGLGGAGVEGHPLRGDGLDQVGVSLSSTGVCRWTAGRAGGAWCARGDRGLTNRTAGTDAGVAGNDDGGRGTGWGRARRHGREIGDRGAVEFLGGLVLNLGGKGADRVEVAHGVVDLFPGVGGHTGDDEEQQRDDANGPAVVPANAVFSAPATGSVRTADEAAARTARLERALRGSAQSRTARRIGLPAEREYRRWDSAILGSA